MTQWERLGLVYIVLLILACIASALSSDHAELSTIMNSVIAGLAVLPVIPPLIRWIRTGSIFPASAQSALEEDTEVSASWNIDYSEPVVALILAATSLYGVALSAIAAYMMRSNLDDVQAGGLLSFNGDGYEQIQVYMTGSVFEITWFPAVTFVCIALALASKKSASGFSWQVS